MKKLLISTLILVGSMGFVQAQSVAEYKAQIDKLKGDIKTAEAGIADLEKKILEYPGWRFGAAGLIGLNFSGSNNFVTNPLGPQATTTTIGINPTAFAYYNADKYFWRNDGLSILTWQKIDTGLGVTDGTNDLRQTSDLLKINSLGGYKLTRTIALSANAAFETPTFISPKEDVDKVAYLDLGAGATYIPNEKFTLMVHPLSYRFVFAEEGSQYESSAGCKILATYATELIKGVNWTSGLDGFLSYKGKADLTNADNTVTPDVGLHSLMWTNTFGFKVFNGIAVGITSALRYNEQEVNSFNVNPDNGNYEDIKLNVLQHNWLVGMSYNLTF
ncbi:MAG: DUF3078 domain-containing protein [Chitinophagales bacterium]|nr:DUF3078 domain-containing protein [Bacteroidota bacterium]MCB9042370.1 DUF3078 domain-containing protein [Chitinophagales bacterium]